MHGSSTKFIIASFSDRKHITYIYNFIEFSYYWMLWYACVMIVIVITGKFSVAFFWLLYEDRNMTEILMGINKWRKPVW